jgi:hypothetical protein
MGNNQVQAHDGASVNLPRHQAQCSVCRHPRWQDIEQDWLDGVSPQRIEDDYDIGRYSLYRHCHHLGFFDKRPKNIRRVLEGIIERVEYAPTTLSGVVSAIKAYSKLTGAEQKVEEAQGTAPQGLFKRMSKEEREDSVRNGSLPPWVSRAEGATPDDSQLGGKEMQVTENKSVQ